MFILGDIFLKVEFPFNSEGRAQQSCTMVPRWRFFHDVFASCICSEPHAAGFRPAS